MLPALRWTPVVPARIVRRAKLSDDAIDSCGTAILSVKAEQIAVACQMHAGFFGAGAGADRVTHRGVLERAQASTLVREITGGLLCTIARATEKFRRDQLIRERDEVLPCFGERFAASLNAIDHRRVLIAVVMAPDGEREANLLEIVYAGDSLPFGFSLCQRRQE